MRIRLPRGVTAVVTAVLLGALPGCARPADPLADLAASVPAELAADGLVLRRGAAGATLLAGQLGLDEDEVRGSLRTGAPALRVLRVDDAGGVVAGLGDRGFAAADGTWVRPAGRAGLVGVPAVAVHGDLVAVGSPEQLADWLEGGPSLQLPTGVLEGAAVALVEPGRGGSTDGAVPAFTTAVLTVDEDGAAGRLALQLEGEGSQQDAVGLDVRVRTAGPLGPDGRPLLEPAAPLTQDAVTGLVVRWTGDPEAALLGGLSTGLLDFLTG